MIALPFLADRTVAVLGLARSGRAAARALAASGARVVAWDDSPQRRADPALGAAAIGETPPGGWGAVDLLVPSPGVPLTFPAPHPWIVAARAAGVPVEGDIELLWRARGAARIAAVTGTNGKSTTTALLGHVLAGAGMTVAVGGNLGTAVLDLEPLAEGGVYVIEVSSYQLDLLDRASFDVAVLLNVTPDHLDRHGTMANYVAAKRRVFAGQEPWATAIVGVDDPIAAGIARELAEGAGETGRRVVPVSGLGRVEGGVHAEDGALVDRTGPEPVRVMRLDAAPALPGAHNAQNAAAAYAAARALGLAPDAIATAIASYPGLPHRQELVAVIDAVAYVNDSKATNADAAARALACYDPIYWIAGGVAKEGGIEALAPLFPRIARAFLIGEAAERFAATLDGLVPAERAGDLAAALAAARDRALADRRPGAVVLLSPAAASFDQFRDYEARGDRFRALVEALPGRRGRQSRPGAGA